MHENRDRGEIERQQQTRIETKMAMERDTGRLQEAELQLESQLELECAWGFFWGTDLILEAFAALFPASPLEL